MSPKSNAAFVSDVIGPVRIAELCSGRPANNFENVGVGPLLDVCQLPGSLQAFSELADFGEIHGSVFPSASFATILSAGTVTVPALSMLAAM